MPKKHRLSRASFPKGPQKRASGMLFSMQATPLLGSVEPKFACVISKKTVRSAAGRNRLKRQTREALRLLAPTLLKSYAVVMYPRRIAADASFAEIRVDLQALLGKIAR